MLLLSHVSLPDLTTVVCVVHRHTHFAHGVRFCCVWRSGTMTVGPTGHSFELAGERKHPCLAPPPLLLTPRLFVLASMSRSLRGLSLLVRVSCPVIR